MHVSFLEIFSHITPSDFYHQPLARYSSWRHINTGDLWSLSSRTHTLVPGSSSGVLIFFFLHTTVSLSRHGLTGWSRPSLLSSRAPVALWWPSPTSAPTSMLPLQRSGITGRRTRHTGKLAHGRGYLVRSPQPSSVPAHAPCSPWLALPDLFSATRFVGWFARRTSSFLALGSLVFQLAEPLPQSNLSSCSLSLRRTRSSDPHRRSSVLVNHWCAARLGLVLTVAWSWAVRPCACSLYRRSALAPCRAHLPAPSPDVPSIFLQHRVPLTSLLVSAICVCGWRKRGPCVSLVKCSVEDFNRRLPSFLQILSRDDYDGLICYFINCFDGWIDTCVRRDEYPACSSSTYLYNACRNTGLQVAWQLCPRLRSRRAV
jgi:hypothetical protein